MTQVGGSAAINGFLYQLLHHIDLITNVHVKNELFRAQKLVLEPLDGGDARAEECSFVRVEQYKTRANRTWSVADVIEVLRNLRQAVQEPHVDDALYRFVTNGRRGRFREFDGFLERIGAVSSIHDLDDETQRKFINGQTMSDQQFLHYIDSKTRSRTSKSSNTNELLTLLHLLSHFEMEFLVSYEHLHQRIDAKLRRYVPHRGAEKRIRERLIGVLMDELSSGELHLTQKEIYAMLRDVELSPERMCKLEALHRTMGALNANRLRGLNYDPELDVRSKPEWPSDKPVLLITGESGVGKTWQLGSLIRATANEDRVATLVPSPNLEEDLPSHAARDIWQTGLGETTDLTIMALSNHLKALDYDNRELVVAFDDIRDSGVARSLISEDWSALEMRLVLTVPSVVARSLSGESNVCVHEVKDFSFRELREVLSTASHAWDDIPYDLRKHLQKPILAGIFLRLEHTSFASSPQSEYEIYHQYWQRIAEKGVPYDDALVMDLAAHFFHTKQIRLPRQSWRELELNPESVERLERVGWLRNDEGYVSFAHDRLLNWAVAKSLTRDYLAEQYSLDSLGDYLLSTVEGSVSNGATRLGYVPMDALWLLAHKQVETSVLTQLIGRLEESREFGSYGMVLYTDLLPTLGTQAVPILTRRLYELTQAGTRDFRSKLIAQGLSKLAHQDDIVLREPLLSLLESTSIDLQNAALTVFTTTPAHEAHERIWELHQKRAAKLHEESNASTHTDYQTTFEALKAAILQNPEWLSRRLRDSTIPAESLPSLAFQLHSLEGSYAHEIWFDTRDILIDRMPSTKPRGLLQCIARFKDAEKIDFVTQHLHESDDFASGAAIYALTVIDPMQVLERLSEFKVNHVFGFKNWWIPILLRNHLDLTRNRVLEYAQSDDRGFNRITDIFNAYPNQIDEPILRFLFLTLEQELDDELIQSIQQIPFWLDRRLEFLNQVTRPELLALFEEEKGGDLERKITDIACRLNESSTGNHKNRFLENARRFLLTIGGKGLSRLLRHQLTSNDPVLIASAMSWAVVCNEPRIDRDIVASLHQAHQEDGDGEAGQELETLQGVAMETAALLGADEVLVKMLEDFGARAMTSQLAFLRRHRGQLIKDLTSNAKRTLEQRDTDEDRILSALAVAWLSGDRDMIPLVRALLRDADPAGTTARYACIALDALGDASEEFLDLLVPMLNHGHSAEYALPALTIAGENGLQRIRRWLATRLPEHYDTVDIAAIRTLHGSPSTRETAVLAAVQACQQEHDPLDLPFDIAAESDDARVRKRISDVAFDPNRLNSLDRVQAIEGLAKFDIESAVLAARDAIRNEPIHDELFTLLVAIDPKRGIQTLVETAISTPRSTLRKCIGRALRRIDSEEVYDHLSTYLTNGSKTERLRAAEIARWLTDTRIKVALKNAIETESEIEVKLAILRVVNAHEHDVVIKKLIQLFAEADIDRKWRFLVKITESGNPHMLSNPSDELSFTTAL